MAALKSIARLIDGFNQSIGEIVAWLASFMVLIQFAVVLFRYIFGYGSIFMQESIIYMHALLFMLGAGYTLLHGGHVRVDIFYREASSRWKAKVDIFGILTFLFPVCTAIWIFSFPYVANSWGSFEGSKETSGIQAIFLLKTSILVFCALMVMQGLAMLIHSLLHLQGAEDAPMTEEHEGL